ncbi:soluble guanylate cyclase 88E isoform X2 [Ciona intestinalis]
MYGFVLESIVDCVHEQWGEEVWMELVGEMGFDTVGFSIHTVYEESMIPLIAQTLSKMLQITEDDIMFQFGGHFMTFVSSYGYDQITKVLGRRICDFINSLDNLHDYISNLYKDIKPPSFYVETEDDKGLTFHYNTPRKYFGYIHYVRGLVHTAAIMHYNLHDSVVEVVKQEMLGEVMHGIIRIKFQNGSVGKQGAWMPALAKLRSVTPVSVNSDVVLNSFPFSIIFGENMEVITCGAGVVKTFPTLVGKKVTDFFVLTKPIGMPLSWTFMKNRPVNVLVEMTSTVALWAEYEEYLRSQVQILGPEHPPPHKQRDDSISLKLRGTSAFLESWNAVIFMCTPVFDNMDVMKDVGLYISDLSFQDSLQMLLMAGPQQSAELKIALNMEQGKTAKMEETLEELEKENRKTDALLFSMIPREIAKRLKKGEGAVNLAEMFPDVTVLFSDIVGFTNICTRITPMEVVCILNTIYTVFDVLSERYAVFKVETIGDGYMAVSGAPVRTKEHAQRISDMALEMQAGIRHVKNPADGELIRIRIGIHSGGVVAGVVGRKMIRYCLFGDTVNTASRMESTGKGGEIHISTTVRDQLVQTEEYLIKDRGIMYVKGKGQMRTYWLNGKKGKYISIANTVSNTENQPKHDKSVQMRQALNSLKNYRMKNTNRRNAAKQQTQSDVTKPNNDSAGESQGRENEGRDANDENNGEREEALQSLGGKQNSTFDLRQGDVNGKSKNTNENAGDSSYEETKSDDDSQNREGGLSVQKRSRRNRSKIGHELPGGSDSKGKRKICTIRKLVGGASNIKQKGSSICIVL